MTKFQIVVTGIELDGIKAKVPDGLSELLNSARAWGAKKGKSLTNEYVRQVKVIDGRITTILTVKKQERIVNSV